MYLHYETLYIPSQVGSGWLQKWFFSQISESSWLSLYPRSHWKDTVEPMDRSLLNRKPFTGIPGSIQEYVSRVTTREIQIRKIISRIWQIIQINNSSKFIYIYKSTFCDYLWVLSVSAKADDEYQIIHLHCLVGCHTVCQIQFNHLYLSNANKMWLLSLEVHWGHETWKGNSIFFNQ